MKGLISKIKVFLRPEEVHEIVRISIPSFLSIDKRKQMLEAFCEVQSALMSSDGKGTTIELTYHSSQWRFTVSPKQAISFNSDCLWIPEEKEKTIVPFNMMYLQEISFVSSF